MAEIERTKCTSVMFGDEFRSVFVEGDVGFMLAFHSTTTTFKADDDSDSGGKLYE